MPITVLIGDDEPLARRRLRRFCQLELDLDVVAECDNGAAVVEQAASVVPQVVLLDIQMPGPNGLELAEVLRHVPIPPIVVFVTAHAEFAVPAFRVGVLDYLLKPVDPDAFRTTMSRVRSLLAERASAAIGRRVSAALSEPAGASEQGGGPLAHAGGARFLDRIAVRSRDRTVLVRVADIDHLAADRNYVDLHVGKVVHRIRDSLTNIEGKLDPRRFVRIHRQSIVNIDQIQELQPWFTGDFVVVLRNGSRLKLSRTYRERLDAALYQRERA